MQLQQGHVQVCLDRTWTWVCEDESWTEPDAAVVCRQLGYTKSRTLGNNYAVVNIVTTSTGIKNQGTCLVEHVH